MSILKSAADTFEKIGSVLDPTSVLGLNSNSSNSRSLNTSKGGQTRQSQIPANRMATVRRQMMRFIAPEQPIVDMYVNPKSVQYKYGKLINKTRTKGGYALQYWGEEMPNLLVQGTTGTSGIEGVNVLLDVYRNEQLMFDPYAIMLEAARDKAEQESFDNELFGNGGILGLEGGTLGALNEAASMASDFLSSAQNRNILNSRNKPTLASMAFTVEIYWCGEVYRGFFEDFSFTESVDHLGIFEYTFNFKVTQKRGFRTNYLAWHKSPTNGPSNWSAGGPPLSYGTLQGSNSNVGRVQRFAINANINVLNSVAETVTIDAFDI